MKHSQSNQRPCLRHISDLLPTRTGWILTGDGELNHFESVVKGVCFLHRVQREQQSEQLPAP